MYIFVKQLPVMLCRLLKDARFARTKRRRRRRGRGAGNGRKEGERRRKPSNEIIAQRMLMDVLHADIIIRNKAAQSHRREWERGGEGGGGDRQEERRIERKETKTTTEKME